MTDPNCNNPVVSDIFDYSTSNKNQDQKVRVQRDYSNSYNYRGAFQLKCKADDGVYVYSEKFTMEVRDTGYCSANCCALTTLGYGAYSPGTLTDI